MDVGDLIRNPRIERLARTSAVCGLRLFPLLTIAAVGTLLARPSHGEDLPPATTTETSVTSPDYLYFSTRNSSVVPGVSGPYDDADIYRFQFETGTFTRVFDASAAGLPGNADIDGLHVIDPVNFLMSFDRNDGTTVPGLGLVMDEDIVRYSAGQFSWFLRGSDVGLGDGGSAEDIDAIHLVSEQSLLVSTVGSPVVSGVSGARPQDVLRCDGTFGQASTCSWRMYFDGSANGLSAWDEKIDGLFESSGDLYFSTHGPYSVAKLAGANSDVFRCANANVGTPMRCASFSKFFDGARYGLADDLDDVHYVPDAYSDPGPAGFRIVILGSSTAVGTGATSPEKSWVGLLDAWLGTVTANHEIINLAKGGLTTVPFRNDGSSPLPDANRNISRALDLNPDLIILNFPSNNVSAGIPVATTIAHYREMKAAADARGITVLLTTTQPRNFGELAKRQLLQQEAIAVRAEFGASVIDVYDELTDFNNGLRLKSAYNSGDGTHLSDAGHAYLFRTAQALVASHVTQ